jgi:hypothetical protein
MNILQSSTLSAFIDDGELQIDSLQVFTDQSMSS